MKPPPPRTLAATPTPQLRTPHAARHDARFPSLAIVLAGGALVPACADPVCGETRADELEAHGRLGVRAAGRGEASEALREVGVALGVVSHTSTTVTPTMPPSGAPPPVVVTPPVAPPETHRPQERIRPSGGAMRVAPVPSVQVPPTTPTQVHRPIPPAGARRPTTPQPQTVAPPSPVPIAPRHTGGEPMPVGPLPRPPTGTPSP